MGIFSSNVYGFIKKSTKPHMVANIWSIINSTAECSALCHDAELIIQNTTKHEYFINL